MIKQLLYPALCLLILVETAFGMEYKQAQIDLKQPGYICMLNTFVNQEAERSTGFNDYVKLFEKSLISLNPKDSIDYSSALKVETVYGKMAKMYIDNIYFCRNGASILSDMGINPSSSSMEEAVEKVRAEFLKELDQTCARVTDACFAVQYGKKHPFNIKIRTYLKDVLFYKRPIFKELLKTKFNVEHPGSPKDSPAAVQWEKQIHTAMSTYKISGNLYFALSEALEFLEVETPLTPEDCQISTLEKKD